MPPNDVAFTFDPASVLNGVKRIDKGMTKMTQGFASTARSMTKSVTKGVLAATAVVGSLVGAFRGLGNILKRMPEIGEVFGIAKDIFFRNFLFPIRKELMPLLQGLLDWVRDNRATFVRWGQAVANVIRSVVMIARRFLEMAKEMLATAGDLLGMIIGEQIDSFAEFVNIVTFKIAAVVIFLGILLKPLAQGLVRVVKTLLPSVVGLLGEVINLVFKLGQGLLEGVAPYIDAIAGNIAGIVDNVTDFIAKLTTANEKGNSIRDVFREIGRILGDVLKFATEMIERFTEGLFPVLEQIATPLKEIVSLIGEIIKDLFTGSEQIKFWGDIFNIVGTILGAIIMVHLKAVEVTLRAISVIVKFLVEGFVYLAELGKDWGQKLGARLAERFPGMAEQVPGVIEKGAGIASQLAKWFNIEPTQLGLPEAGATNNVQLQVVLNAADMDPDQAAEAIKDALVRAYNENISLGAR